MSELGISHLETVLLSVPESQRSWEGIEPLWRTLEELAGKEKVFTLGTADLDKLTLEQVYKEALVCTFSNFQIQAWRYKLVYSLRVFVISCHSFQLTDHEIKLFSATSNVIILYLGDNGVKVDSLLKHCLPQSGRHDLKCALKGESCASMGLWWQNSLLPEFKIILHL